MVEFFRIAVNKKKILTVLTLLFVFLSSYSWGQVTATWDMQTITPTISGTGLSVGNISQGNNNGTTTLLNNTSPSSGYTGATGNNNAGAAARVGALNTGSSGSAYFEFTITPDAGCSFTLTDISFGSRSSGTGPANYTLRNVSSLGTDLGANGTLSTAGTWQLKSNTGLSIGGSSAITLRLYGYGGAGSPGINTANWRIDDLILTMSTSCAGTCTPPTTTITPVTQTVCAGSSAIVSVSSSATVPSYTWQSSSTGTGGWSTVTTGTNAISVSPASTTYYQALVAENGTCTATSATAQVVVNTAPSITTQPTNNSITSGGTATYTVAASGSGLSYQWQQNTGSGYVNIVDGGASPVYAGATTSVLTISNVPLSMNGYSYQCVVSNACGTASTTSASLIVSAGPCINEGFNAGTSAPIGWSFTGIGSTYTSGGNFGNSSPAIAFDDNADRVVTSSISPNVATQLSFWLKGQGTNATSALLVEGFDGSSWVTIENIMPLPTVPTTKTYNSGSTPALPSNIVQFRFTYTKNAGNLAFDDVVVTCTTGCSAPTTTISPATQTICSGANVSISVSSSASVPSYTWQSSSTGNSGWSTVTTGTNAISVNPGSTTYYQALVSENGTCTATSSTAQVVVNTVPVISSQPASVSTTSTGVAAFTVTATGGNLSYQWLENTGSGFVNISDGGTNPTYAGATTSVLTISNPPMSMGGYSYQCVVSNACGTTTTNGLATLTVVINGCAYINSVFVDACPGTPTVCAEGLSEAVFITNGSNVINVSTSANAAANITVRYGTNSAYGSNATITDGFVNNAAAITCLNSKTGCTGVFIDALGGTIPAFAKIMIVRSDFCCPTGTGQTDFSALCSGGVPIYVLFSNDGTLISGGTYKNGPSSTCPNELRYFRLTTSGSGAGCSNFDCYYDACLLTSQGDGDYVKWTTSGGAATYGNSGCTVPLVVLPIELLDFYGTENGATNELFWKVATEQKVNYYIVEKSNDGVEFVTMDIVPLNNVQGIKTYKSIDYSPSKEISYYRLSTKENDGSVKHYGMISIDENSDKWQYNYFTNDDNLIVEFKNSLPKNSTLSLYDLSGKLLIEESVVKSQTEINTAAISEGIYFVRITTPYRTENFKFVIQK